MNRLENKTIEYKREYTDDIKYAVIAFANTDGGKLYIGMNDDGSVCGVFDVDDIMLRLTNLIRDVVRPDVTMFTECGIETVDGKNLVVLNVQRGTARPYYLHSKGVRPEGVYVRQGASSVPASETAILNMIQETSGDCYENARSLNQQLTFETASAYFPNKNVGFGDAQKRTLNLISDDGTYSNLAMLLSDQCTHTIKMAVFEGSKKSVFKDRRELNGSLLKQLEQAYFYINQFNRTRAEFNGLHRVDQRDYPEEAIREALVNAVVHRDYSISGSTLISIFDDRMEFITIGGLITGISYDDIMLGVSALRNQHLANVFYRLQLIEAYGTGIMKINESYQDYEVKPKIDISNHAFKITLPNTNFKEQSSMIMESNSKFYTNLPSYNEREITVLALFEEKTSIIRKDVETVLKISQSTAGLLLRSMVENHLLYTTGKGRNLHYHKYQ